MREISMDSKVKLAIKFIFSIAVFALLFYFVGIDKIVQTLSGMDKGLLAIGIVLYILVNLSMSLRIKVALSSIGKNLGLFEIFKSNMAGMLASDFTPSRAGYLLTALSISTRNKIDVEKTMLAIVGPQLIDFSIKAASAAILLSIILSSTSSDGMLMNAAMILVVLGGVVFAGLLIFYPPFLERIRFLEKIPLMSSGFRFLSKMHKHSDKLFSVKGKIFLVTMLSWVLKGVEWFVLARALGIDITGNILYDFGFMMFFQAAVTILQFLPLPTIAGAGASEAGFAAILFFFGVPAETGIAFGFLTRIVMVAVDAFSLPIIFDFIHKFGFEKLLSKLSGRI
jgi:hypothetical protein